MLNPRHVISLTVSISVLSVLWSVVELMRPPDGNGLRSDSFGTHAHGYRAVYDTLRELNVPVRRSIGPPIPASLGSATLVLWSPSLEIISLEQKWAEGVGQWVHNGGHVVVALGSDDHITFLGMRIPKPPQVKKKEDEVATSRELLELIGLSEVKIVMHDDTKSALSIHSGSAPNSVDEVLEQTLIPKLKNIPLKQHTLTATGSLASRFPSEPVIAIPETGLFLLEINDAKPEGTLNLKSDEDKPQTVAAQFKVGSGMVTLFSVPDIMMNAAVSKADNLRLISKLILSDSHEVVFDEFFHGLSIRGNAMWLFAQETYGTIALALLLLIGLLVWRSAVFLGSPLPEKAVSRRSIVEYLEAMARFMREGRNDAHWTLTQLRDGVLWKLRREHGLPPELADERRLLKAMERRAPGRAEELELTLDAIRDLTSSNLVDHERKTLPVLRRLLACLLKNDTARCAMKSRK